MSAAFDDLAYDKALTDAHDSVSHYGMSHWQAEAFDRLDQQPIDERVNAMTAPSGWSRAYACTIADESCQSCSDCYLRNGVGGTDDDCVECHGTGCSTDHHRGRE